MAPKFMLEFQQALLQNTKRLNTIIFTGLSPSTESCSKELQNYLPRLSLCLKHHISILSLTWIQFAFRRFHSLLLTASRLISFPTGTKTFQFPASCRPCGLAHSAKRSHSGILGSKIACISPRLFAACHALHRHQKPSHPPNSLYDLFAKKLLESFFCA